MLIYKALLYLLPFVCMLGCACGVISAYATVKKLGFLGDIMSHAAFPGIVITFLLFPKSHFLFLALGGALSSFISALCIFFLEKQTSAPRDTHLALVLSLFFSFGLIVLGIIQKKQIHGQAVLNNLLFGSLFTLSFTDAVIGIILCSLICIFSFISIRQQRILAFDPTYAFLKIKSAKKWDLFFLLSAVLTIIMGLHTVGILLMGALIIAPGACAKLWCNSYFTFVFFSMIIGTLSCVGGTLLSIIFPSLPTSPLIVIIATGFCIFSALYKRLTCKVI